MEKFLKLLCFSIVMMGLVTYCGGVVMAAPNPKEAYIELGIEKPDPTPYDVLGVPDGSNWTLVHGAYTRMNDSDEYKKYSQVGKNLIINSYYRITSEMNRNIVYNLLG